VYYEQNLNHLVLVSM